MNIAIVGTGYVGLVSGTCFAEMGANVTCIDKDKHKIAALLAGEIPIYEPGLDRMVRSNVEAGRLRFATDLTQCIDQVDIVFSAVGTPPDEDGSADLQYVLRSTAAKVKAAIREELGKRGADIEFDVASNPEFLKEGAAVKDFLSPDRVVIGVESERARELMEKLYRPFVLNNYRIIFMDIPSAEMTKYAANAMLATRISFMNDIANLCELVGADVNMVRRGIGSDARIGTKFLYPGCGYGGSCFPKDVKALIRTGREHGYEMRVISAVEEVNEAQKSLLFEKLVARIGPDLRGKRIALWGLAFKPETDDMREATSLVLIDRLTQTGAEVVVFDPVAMDECRRRIGDRVRYAKEMYEATVDADALMVVTEWKQFRIPSWRVVARAMRGKLVLDGRNLYDPADLTDAGLVYSAIGVR